MREVRPRERELSCPRVAQPAAELSQTGSSPIPPYGGGGAFSTKTAVDGGSEEGSLEAEKMVVFGREVWKGQ